MASLVEMSTAIDAVAITKSDTTIVNIDALYVGTTGNVAVVTQKGTTVTFPTVPAGAVIELKCSKVLSTNTTAGGFVGLKY